MFLSKKGISQNRLPPSSLLFSPRLLPSFGSPFSPASLAPFPIPFYSYYSPLSVISRRSFFLCRLASSTWHKTGLSKTSSSYHCYQEGSTGHYPGKRCWFAQFESDVQAWAKQLCLGVGIMTTLASKLYLSPRQQRILW